MKYLFITGFLLIIIFQNIHASEQFPDILIYNGKEYEIGVYPMEAYFEIYPNRRPWGAGTNSALLRGYRAKYEIINNELTLLYLEKMGVNNNWRKISKRNFYKKAKVTAFTGNINLINDVATGVYMGFTPIYKKYIILDIIEGKLARVFNLNCYEYLELIIQSYPPKSYEYKYFTGKLRELYEVMTELAADSAASAVYN